MISRGLSFGNKLLRNSFNKSRLQRKLFYSFGNVEVKLGSIGESVTEATVQSFEKGVGEWVDMDEVVVIMESDKGEADVRTPESGEVVEFKYEIGDDAEIGDIMFVINTDAEKPEGAEEPAPTAAPTQDAAPTPTESAPKAPTPTPQPTLSSESEAFSGPTTERLETRESMSRMRKTVGRRLKESQNTYASVNTFNEIDMHNVMQLRKELGAEFEAKNGVRLGFMSFFLKAAALAMTERPIVNAVIDDETQEIVYRNYIDISVAVSSPKGLVVPVLRDVQNMTFADVERELRYLATKAIEGNLALEDMAGGNFTISNGGVFGSMMSAPIINPPQSAIMGMHNIKNRPVVIGDEIVARPIMFTAMTYDHRLLDGREGAGFLKRMGDLIEDPRRLLLEF